jgi:hypothetical protein
VSQNSKASVIMLLLGIFGAILKFGPTSESPPASRAASGFFGQERLGPYRKKY